MIKYKLCLTCGENKPQGHYILKKDGTRTNRCTDCIIEEQRERWQDMQIFGVND